MSHVLYLTLSVSMLGCPTISRRRRAVLYDVARLCLTAPVGVGQYLESYPPVLIITGWDVNYCWRIFSG